MLSIPVVVHNDYFKWQLDLFWYSQQQVYGKRAADVTLAAVVKRNFRHDPVQEEMAWDLDIPHVMCDAYFDYLGWDGPTEMVHTPLNIQTALAQMLPELDDNEVVEVLDGDMFHMRKAPKTRIPHGELHVDDVYEWWHFKSLSDNRHVIAPYFANGGRFYNGGFVPIIGTVKTFRQILPEWIAVHRHILTVPYEPNIHWWGGMFGLQAACEKAKVRMIAKDYCYVPGVNQLQRSHYAAHYAVDTKFSKRTFPTVDVGAFDNNVFYRRISGWLRSKDGNNSV